MGKGCEPGGSEDEGIDAIWVHREFLKYRKGERDSFSGTSLCIAYTISAFQ